MQIAENVQILLSSSGSKVPVKLTFSPALPQNLQGKSLEGQLIQLKPDGSATLKLPDGQLLKGQLEPALPLKTKLVFTTKTPTEALVRNLFDAQGKPLKQQAPVPTASSKTPLETNTSNTLKPLPTPTAPVAIRPVPTYPHPPLNVNIAGKILTPPKLDGFQTFEAAKLPANIKTQILPRIQIQPPQALPKDTQLTLKLSAQNTAELSNIKAPEKQLMVHDKIQVLPTTVSNPPKSVFEHAELTKLLKNIKLSLPENAPKHANSPSLTLKLNAPLPQPQNQPNNAENLTQTFKIPLPNGQPLTVHSPQGLLTEGMSMVVRIGTDGTPTVLRVLAPENSTQQGKNPQTGAQNQPPAKAAPPSQTAHFPVGTKHTGIVTNQTSQGQMTLTFADGKQLQVEAGRPLPQGTQITVHMTEDGHAEVVNFTLPQGNIRAEVATQLSRQWPLLTKALSLLSSENQDVEESLKNSLPSIEKGLLHNLPRFAEAIALQSADKLLPQETLATLRALGIDFSPDLQQLNTLQQRQENSDNWRGFLFPYIENQEGDPQQGGFFWRNQQDEAGQEQRTRFVIQLKLTDIGEVQLDGLMAKKDIQLKLRLKKQPQPNFVQGLQEITHNALENLGLTGGIQVDVIQTSDFPVAPLSDILNEDHGDYTLSV